MAMSIPEMILIGTAIALGAALAANETRGQRHYGDRAADGTPTPMGQFRREPYSEETQPPPRLWTTPPATKPEFVFAIPPGAVPTRCVQEPGKQLTCEWSTR